MTKSLPWHKAEFDRLLADRQRLPHAVLIWGRQGIGKAQFARALAQGLLCESATAGPACGACSACGWFETSNHPDFRLVEPATLSEDPVEGQEAAKGSRRILIEQVRALADFIHVSSHRNGPKVILIQPAEALNINAANALLKNLEEPPPETFFLLVAHRFQFLLPTVRSRCQHVALSAPEPQAAVEWLHEQGAVEPALALAQTGNSPLLALALSQGGYWEQRDLFLTHLTQGSFDPLAAAEQIRDLPLGDVLSWLQKWTFDLVFQKLLGKVYYNPDRGAALAALAARSDPVPVLRFHRELLAMQRIIDHPLNPRLVLEQLLFDYASAVGAGSVKTAA